MRVLILDGDGIGPEIMRGCVRCIQVLDEKLDLGVELVHERIGIESLRLYGTTFRHEILDLARDCDGIVLGPVATADYPEEKSGGLNPSAILRRQLGLFANIRPSRSVAGALAFRDRLDVVVVRENSEGFYADRNMFLGSGEFSPTPDLALSVRKISREASTRIARVAFFLAQKRRKRLAVVHKANVLKLTDGLFLDSVRTLTSEFPDVLMETYHVDAAASLLLEDPGRFDVIVTTNMFGDILSNVAASIAGGIGLAGSLNHGIEFGVAQAAHGAAPEIAGRDVANPVGLMISGGMLLDWIGTKHDRVEYGYASKCLIGSVEAVLGSGGGTCDVGGSSSTREFIDRVVADIETRMAKDLMR